MWIEFPFDTNMSVVEPELGGGAEVAAQAQALWMWNKRRPKRLLGLGLAAGGDNGPEGSQ